MLPAQCHHHCPLCLCLVDILVLPILSYSCEVLAVSFKVRAKCELVHRQFLKQLLGVTNHQPDSACRIWTCSLIDSLLQQILRYHNRVRALPNSRLD